MSEEIPLGPFVISRPLAQGGMGEVWLGYHASSGVEVAVKVMTAAHLRNETFRRAFSDEVRAVARLDHPNIIRLYDMAVVGPEVAEASGGRLGAGSPYLVMELADGGSLLAAPPETSWPAIRQVLLALLSALAHAHARGVIHRDIKPGNVLWRSPRGSGEAPRAILSDFGIAHAGEGGAPGGPTWGTPAYMAPERFTLEWRDLGPWTDLYSVGCVAFTLLRGRPPFKGAPLAQAMQAHLYRPVPTLRARCAVPDGLDAWLRSMLAKSPEDRFRCAADAAHALLDLGEARTPAHAGPGEIASDPEPTQPTGSASASASASAKRTPSAAASDPPSTGTVEATWTDDTFDPGAMSRGSLRSRGPTRRPTRHPVPPHPADWRDRADDIPPADIPGGGLRLFGLRVVRMVDREAERDAMWRTLGEVRRRRRTRGVLLRGRVGTGKTRLAEWLCEHAEEVGAAIPLRAEHGIGVGVPALARAVAAHLRVGGLGRRALRSRVLAWLQLRGVHDEALSRELVAVASLGAGLALERGEEPRDLRGTMHRFLGLLAKERPVVLHLDDIAWGATSLAFAIELLEQERRLPLMLVLTAREEALAANPVADATLAALGRGGPLQHIDVRPLPHRCRQELVRNLLGVEEALADKVAEGTGGNPLFTVTLVRDWVARGVLRESAAGLTASEPLDVPPTLVGVWEARLVALVGPEESPARRALEVAAALGESLDEAEWRAACDEAGLPLPEDLLDCLANERLAIRRAGGWRFVHDAVRESLLETAAAHDRLVGLHSACARMLEARHADPGPMTRERIGRHLAGAGRLAEAAPALLAGATARLRQDDTASALLVLGEAEGVIAQLAGPEGALQRVEAQLLHTRVLLAQGHEGEARRFAERALRETVDAPEVPPWRLARARALGLLARVALAEGQPDEGHRSLDEARSLVDQEALLSDVGELTRTSGELARAEGRLDEAEEALAEAAQLLGGLGRQAEWAGCVVALAEVEVERGDGEHASALLTSAMERYRLLHHRRGEADVMRVGGEAALLRRELALADQRFRRAQAIYQRLGSRRVRDCRLGRARVAMANGRLAEARRLLEEVRADRPSSRVTQVRIEASTLLLAALEEAWAEFDPTLEALASLRVRTGLRLAEVHRVAAEAARAAGARGQGDRAARVRALMEV